MNNNLQNNNNNLQNNNNSISSIDALNQKLASEIISPSLNTKQVTHVKQTKQVTHVKQPKQVTQTKQIKLVKQPKQTKQLTHKKDIKTPIVIKKPIVTKTFVDIKKFPVIKETLKLNYKKESSEIEDLDEEIRKLELEIKNNNNKSTKQETESIVETHIPIENKVIEQDITDSKKALIKLLLGAKKNKNLSETNTNTNVNESNSTPIMSDKPETSNYEENFNYSQFNETEQNENDEQDMKIEFNDPESAKLIKVIEDEDLNYIVPVNVKIRSTNLNNSFAISRNNVNNLVKSSIYFDIDSENVASYDCYNDYMVNLDKKMKILDINIKSIDFPINESENINNSNNELKIIINNKEQIFELEENYYNRYEIRDFLNEAFNAYEFDITCDIQDGIFIFHSDNKFTMLNHETSILPTLGFNKNAYINKNTYTSENPHQIGDNVYYMVIENISSEPLFYINKDTNEIKKLIDIKEIDTDNLIIKFNKSKKDLIKNSKEYSYFFNDKHTITFELIF